MKALKDEKGQVLILTALALLVLLGFLALAVDVGILFRAKRNIQIAADSAAMGAAMDYLYNKSVTSAQAAGAADATSNGFTNGVGGVGVAINCPPSSGPNTGGGATFCEALISAPNSTFFMNLFNRSSVTVGARAVAGSPATSKGCVYILDPTASQALQLQGSFNFTASNCSIIVDSSDSDALDFTGNGGSLTAGSVSVVGNYGGYHAGESTPVPVTGVAPISDPLQITGPTPTSGCSNTVTTTSLTGTIASPTGGVICYSNAVTMNTVTLGTGTYVFENGLTLNGTVTSGAGGTTLDIYSGALSVTSHAGLALVAPTSGTYSDIALMQPASNTSQITFQKGNSGGSVTGIIYAPTAQLYFQDSGGSLSLTSDLIVGTLFDKTTNVTLNNYGDSHPTSPLKVVTLVE